MKNQISKYCNIGEDLNSSSESEGSRKLGFIGREQDFENSYFALGARQYDAESGRFLSVDPLFEFFPTQSPYSYAFNNPINFSDPSGLSPERESKNEEVQT